MVTGRHAFMYEKDKRTITQPADIDTIVIAVNSEFSDNGQEWVQVYADGVHAYMLMTDLQLISDEEYDRLTATPTPTPTPTLEPTPEPTPTPTQAVSSVPNGGSYAIVKSQRAFMYENDKKTIMQPAPKGSAVIAVNSEFSDNGQEWVQVYVDDVHAYMLISDLQLISDVEYNRLMATPTPTPTPNPTPVPTPTPKALPYIGNPDQVGSYVTFGHYEQDNDLSNGKEPIEWIVLEYDSLSRKSLLLSRYGLDARRFDAETYQGWDKSEIRIWLNIDFLNAAFTGAEQQAIAAATVKTGSNDKWVELATK